MKVTFLTNMISPYRAPVFRELANTKGWNLKVIVDSKKEFDREWNVALEGVPWKKTATFSVKRTVRSEAPIKFEQVLTLHFPFGLIRDLFVEKPDLVISHELGFRTIFASIYCMIMRVPLLIWAYQSKVSASQGERRLFLRKWLLSRAKFALGMGKQAREVLSRWGVPESRIVDALNAADNRSLRAKQSSPRFLTEVEKVRYSYARNKKLAIIVGRLVPLKGIEQFLDTWSDLSEELKSEWQLVFVGNGPLQSLVENNGDDSVSTVGYVNSDDIAVWYAAADLHIFPSCGDVWGLVVNEASVCGTPTLCSVHAGCFDDLIHDGVDGFGVDFSDREAALVKMREALGSKELREIGKVAQSRIGRFNTVNLANRFRYAARLALENTVPVRNHITSA